ncbi:MAG: putative DNA binding domain-containing protein [Kiritimatiellae bacterium]|nr:putative DNA binding domain-containing protein [Kiritimatiellia bacterium]
MTVEELNQIIASGETLSVEFKSDRNRLPDSELTDALAAMANADGGVLLEGVEDDGTITGLHKAHLDVEGIVPLIENRTTPGLTVSVERVDCGDAVCVAVIYVKKSKMLIATNDGKYLRRRIGGNGKPEVVAIKPADVQSWHSSLGVYDPSEMIFEGVSAEELDPLQRVRVRRLIDEYSTEKFLLQLSDEELDKALGFCAEVEGVLHPTLTGLLILGTERLLKRHVPSHEVAFQVLKAGKVKVNEFRRRPLLEIFEEFNMMFGALYSEEEMEIGLFRKGIPNFDKTAFREAFVNALVHRDYNILGCVHIQFDDYGLMISSPGGFIDGVTVDTLLTAAPKSRNSRLADAIKRIGLAERTGRGVDRIFEGLLKYGRPAPDYSESNRSSVTVRMLETKADSLFVRMLMRREDRGVNMPIDSLLVLSALRDGELTARELSSVLKKGEAATRGVIGILLKEGMIEQRIEGRVHVYFLGKAYHQAVGEEVAYTKLVGIDPIRHREMVKAFIMQHGSAKRGDIMKLCDLTRSCAYKLLISMCKRGEIVRKGERNQALYVLPTEARCNEVQ